MGHLQLNKLKSFSAKTNFSRGKVMQQNIKSFWVSKEAFVEYDKNIHLEKIHEFIYWEFPQLLIVGDGTYANSDITHKALSELFRKTDNHMPLCKPDGSGFYKPPQIIWDSGYDLLNHKHISPKIRATILATLGICNY
jgi:hypothetical protein